ncbi:VOC family protein [Rhodococcus sp. IEGM 1379]|uniref:VOC family protein n=1 Tax=Rhodococcus sp. IEGM 1379 TaxID=3047086 RepID=UPI0024B64B4F|nr:VOC family protein [Rhodococcus sp. IEGM 1379]MDI9918876.1 VOC family protein [Rhodococcus sp. IEGM 1379]
MAVAHLGSITLDCDDPSTLAAFWRDLLDGEITYSSEKFVAVKIPQGMLTMMRVPDHREPSWPASAVPKQIHFDLVVADLDAGEAEAVRLGARIASEQFAPERCRVLLDPAGHPFCLCLPQNFAKIGG